MTARTERIHVPRILVVLAIGSVLAACGGQVASPSQPVAEATATPSPTATPTEEPTPDPTPDPVAFGEAYVAISAGLADTACPGQAIIDAAPEDPAAWNEAMAIIGPGLEEYAASLREHEPPSVVEDEVEMLLRAIDERAAAAEEITTLGSMDDIYLILDTTFASTGETIVQAGEAIRAALDLPPRDPNVCD
jgi:hypothetical protein